MSYSSGNLMDSEILVVRRPAPMERYEQMSWLDNSIDLGEMVEKQCSSSAEIPLGPDLRLDFEAFAELGGFMLGQPPSTFVDDFADFSTASPEMQEYIGVNHRSLSARDLTPIPPSDASYSQYEPMSEERKSPDFEHELINLPYAEVPSVSLEFLPPHPHVPSFEFSRSYTHLPKPSMLEPEVHRSKAVSPQPHHRYISNPAPTRVSRRNKPQVFDINGKKTTKSEYLQHMVMNNVNPDRRVLKQIKCDLNDIVTTDGLLLKLCMNKFGSRYMQTLLDTPNTPLRYIEMMIYAVIEPASQPRALQAFSKSKQGAYKSKRSRYEPMVGDGNRSFAQDESMLGVVLCCNKFGNYIIQKLLHITVEAFDEFQANKESMIGTMTDKDIDRLYKLNELGEILLQQLLHHNVKKLALNHCSCRIVQKVLMYPSPKRVAIKEQILNEIVEFQQLDVFVTHAFGNHVIQKCIEHIPKESLKKMCAFIEKKVFVYSVNIYGCRVIQAMISHCTLPQIERMLRTIENRCIELCQDQFGNYVIQRVAECFGCDRSNESNVFDPIVIRICDNIRRLCLDKFASNVVETCLRVAKPSHQSNIIRAILYHRSHTSVLVNLITNEYGNYVIQTMLDICTKSQHSKYSREILRQIHAHLSRSDLMKCQWGKYVMKKVEALSAKNQLDNER